MVEFVLLLDWVFNTATRISSEKPNNTKETVAAKKQNIISLYLKNILNVGSVCALRIESKTSYWIEFENWEEVASKADDSMHNDANEYLLSNLVLKSFFSFLFKLFGIRTIKTTAHTAKIKEDPR